MDMGWYYVVVICVFIFIIVPHLVSAFFLSTHNIGYINPRLRGSDVPYKTNGVRTSKINIQVCHGGSKVRSCSNPVGSREPGAMRLCNFAACLQDQT
jgi:hypothetical protein